MKIEISRKSYVLFFFFLIITYSLFLLRYELLLLFLALIVAMSLFNAEKFLLAKKVPRKVVMPVLILTYLGIIFSIVFIVVPTVVDQIIALSKNFPQIKAKILHIEGMSTIENGLKDYLSKSPQTLAGLRDYMTEIGRETLGGLLSIGIFFVLSLYMYIDGSRSYKWFRAHFNRSIQLKLDQTVDEIGPIMTAYVFGQSITSTVAAAVVYIAAILLKVPAAMALAALAAIFDILPGIGFIFIIISAGILSLAVSPRAMTTMIIVLGAYHLFESYFLAPYVYGNKMKLSPLVVLLSMVLAATLAGVPGMIAILPLVAAYNAFEKIWLKINIPEGEESRESLENEQALH